MTVDVAKVIKRPVITEKATQLKASRNQVVFEVYKSATKPLIKAAVEKAFKVKVENVNTMIMRGKTKRRRRAYVKLGNWKKAIVTLKQGDKIEIFEGV